MGDVASRMLSHESVDCGVPTAPAPELDRNSTCFLILGSERG